MKTVYIITFYLLTTITVIAQKNEFGIKSGVGLIDGPTSGLNLELSYKNKLSNKFTFGINIGATYQNSFPDFFKPSQQLTTGVPLEVNDYILSLNLEKDFTPSWESNTINYIQAIIEYELPFRFFKTNFNLFSGLMLSHNNVNFFSLRKYSTMNNRIINYTPRYRRSVSLESGWVLGIGLKHQINQKYNFSFEAKHNIIFAEKNSNIIIYPSVVTIIQVGVSRIF